MCASVLLIKFTLNSHLGSWVSDGGDDWGWGRGRSVSGSGHTRGKWSERLNCLDGGVETLPVGSESNQLPFCSVRGAWGSLF